MDLLLLLADLLLSEEFRIGLFLECYFDGLGEREGEGLFDDDFLLHFLIIFGLVCFRGDSAFCVLKEKISF